MLENYGSDEDFVITSEKSRRDVCSDHSLKPFNVLRTDRNGNRSKCFQRKGSVEIRSSDNINI